MKYVDSMNRPRTESLFKEMIGFQSLKKFDPVYTMKESIRSGLPSAYLIYMEALNEYDAAMKIVGSMRHWERLCKLKWFMDGSEAKSFSGLSTWREHKAMKEERDALILIKEQAENGNVPAQKILLDRAKKVSRAGRPLKDRDNFKQDLVNAKITELHKKLGK